MDHAPVLPPSRPLFRDVHHRQIQHFQQAVVCGKHRFGLGHLAQMATETLYGVGGIDQPAYLLRVLEICTQIGPVQCPKIFLALSPDSCWSLLDICDFLEINKKIYDYR